MNQNTKADVEREHAVAYATTAEQLRLFALHAPRKPRERIMVERKPDGTLVFRDVPPAKLLGKA